MSFISRDRENTGIFTGPFSGSLRRK
jgi:hypothetical protein